MTLWLNMGDSYAGTHASYEKQKHRWQHTESQGRPPVKTDNSALKGAGLKPKDLCGIPWRVALALQADGWWLRSDIIWAKPNPMPESVIDRPTRSHEYVFLLTKSAKYFYDADAVREPHTWDDKRQFKPGGRPNHHAKYRNKVKYGGGGTGFDGHSGNFKADGSSLNHPLGRNLRSVWTIATEPTSEAHFATFPEKLVIPCIKAGTATGDTVLDPFSGSGKTLIVAQKFGRKGIGIELNPEYCKMSLKKVAQNRLF